MDERTKNLITCKIYATDSEIDELFRWPGTYIILAIILAILFFLLSLTTTPKEDTQHEEAPTTTEAISKP